MYSDTGKERGLAATRETALEMPFTMTFLNFHIYLILFVTSVNVISNYQTAKFKLCVKFSTCPAKMFFLHFISIYIAILKTT